MANGKGSARRPQQITNAELERKWNETFEAHELRIQSHPKERARRLAASTRMALRFPDVPHDTMTDAKTR
jgi:hypothetical protein